MEIGEVLKQATAYKKSNGYSFALDFLLQSYDANKPDDLYKLLDKIYTYFSHDLENQKVKEFIATLIASKTLGQYSGLLSSYYWMLKDYESYKLTIMNQISKVNPSLPWHYCYDLRQLQNSLCNYYRVIGLDNENNAIDYLYNLLSSTFFDVAGELMMHENNFTGYYLHLQHGDNLTFYNPDRLIPLSESVEEWFDDESDDDSKCLKTFNCKVPRKKIIQLIKQKIFYDFPKQLGFNIDILSKKNKDVTNCALSHFRKEDYENIVLLTDKILEWKKQIASKTVRIAMDETNFILKELCNLKQTVS